MRSLVLLISLSFLTPSFAIAGGYSDYSANKARGQSSSGLTLKYGGSYGQAAESYMNNRYGYGTGKNNDYYSRQYQPKVPSTQQKQELSPEQKAEIDRLMKQSDDLINRINNDSKLWN